MKINFHIIKDRKKYLAFSFIAVLLSIISFLVIPMNLSIDFKGGELIQLKFENTFDRDKLNQTLKNLENDIPELKNNRLQYSEDGTVVLRTGEMSDSDRDKLLQEINENVGNFDLLKNDKVGPTVGKELTRNAINSLVIGSILITIYMTVRFEFIYAISGLLALLHDVIIMIGLVVFLKLDIDTPFIAALLTILGYSINDTIVVFDRIRENENNNNYKNKTFAEIIEMSLNQVFMRSLYTSITTIISVLMLIIFGGDSLKTFSIALLIGLIFGTYSSLFMASPLVYILRKYKKTNKPKNNKSSKNRKSGKTINGYDEADKVLV